MQINHKNKYPIAIVNIEQLNLKFVADYYDIPIYGTCTYNNQLAEFILMDDIFLMYIIYELSLYHKLKWILRKSLFELCVGHHKSYPKLLSQHHHFYYRNPQWLYKLLFKLYYKIIKKIPILYDKN